MVKHSHRHNVRKSPGAVSATAPSGSAALSDLQIAYLPPEDLHPTPHNARTHSKKQLKQIARSIERFGFVNPVLIADDFEIIAGHARVETAKMLGLKEKNPEGNNSICRTVTPKSGQRRDRLIVTNEPAPVELDKISRQTQSETSNLLPKRTIRPCDRCGRLKFSGNCLSRVVLGGWKIYDDVRSIKNRAGGRWTINR